MSNTVLATLPRFDDMRSPDSDAVVSDLPVTKDVGSESPDLIKIETVEERATTSEVDPIPESLALEGLLSELQNAMVSFSDEAESRIIAMLLEVADNLFPRLSALFLADELAQHLPEVLQIPEPYLEIRTSPTLATEIGALAASRGLLSERCSIVSVASAKDEYVDITWGTGGFVVDFAERLEVQLGRLRASKSGREG